MNDGSGASVEQRAEVVEGSGDIDVGDVHVPVFVRSQGLNEASTFLGRLGVPSLDEPCGFEDAVGRRGAHGDDIAVEHSPLRAR